MGADRCAADRLRPDRWLRHGRHGTDALCRPDRQRAARRDQHHRAALGWQPGVVHHRGRRAVRCLADGLCSGLLRAVLGDAAGAVRAVLPAGGLRLPQQGRGPALAQRLGLGAVRWWGGAGVGVRRCLRQPVSRSAVPARRIDALDLSRLVLRASQPVRVALRRRQPEHAQCPWRRLADAAHRRRAGRTLAAGNMAVCAGIPARFRRRRRLAGVGG